MAVAVGAAAVSTVAAVPVAAAASVVGAVMLRYLNRYHLVFVLKEKKSLQFRTSIYEPYTVVLHL